MGDSVNMESHLSSAVAFVEGGIQDACDDSCSICLEAFVDSDPSTVTSCKHEFHLQCILEWCQRSAQCPMCWQDISLKDPTSQELLEAVEHERRIRSNQTQRTSIFHHPSLGEFDLQQLSMGANDAELEERIIQHLTAAAAMGRAHHLTRREGQRGRSSAQGRHQFLVFSAHPNASSTGSAPVSSVQVGEDEPAPPVAADSSSAMLIAVGSDPAHQAPNTPNTPAHGNQFTGLSSGSSVTNANRISAGQSTPVGQDRAGPSDFQAFSESLKSRLNTVSTRYKESITKSTRGWKERLFSRNTSVADIGSEVRREVNAGIASVTRMMERLDTRDSRKTPGASVQQNVPGTSLATERVTENTSHVRPDTTSTSTVHAATSPN
ncbi:E3 ubiquitin-protein ligase RHF2A-like [Iris pallida]|uniref:RING-type E3 ubiquitin transferase n=1 Tax=Iris pallida TaxID=29817 RepID=A0AAX6FZH2_IRIPA|nr:E3 ubiquitin-protein ligase RHF2A-like [Iris pallida]